MKCENCKYKKTKFCNSDCLHYKVASKKTGSTNSRHEQAKKMLERKVPPAKICEKLGIKIGNLRTIASRLGIRTKTVFRWREIAEYYKTHTTKETCLKFKCSADQVWTYSSRLKHEGKK